MAESVGFPMSSVLEVKASETLEWEVLCLRGCVLPHHGSLSLTAHLASPHLQLYL